MTVKELQKLNNIKNVNKIKAGQEINVDKFSINPQPTPPMQMMEPQMQMAPQPIQEPAYGRSGGIYSPQQMRQMSLYSKSLANKQGLGLGSQ